MDRFFAAGIRNCFKETMVSDILQIRGFGVARLVEQSFHNEALGF